MPQTATVASLVDRQVEVETPEHVAIGYELADLGSRFAALLLDGLIVLSGLLVLGLGLPLLATWLHLPGWITKPGLAALIIGAFVWTWGYFFYFEGFRDGQTPGKRRMRIRAVHDGGYPLTARGAGVRNLLRLLDMQPGFTGVVGGVSMMLSGKTKRLGDLAAGTVVVRERLGGALPEEASAGAAVGPPRLPAEEYAWLTRYVARRESLDPPLRTRLAAERAARVGTHVADDPRRQQMSHDGFLVVLHREETSRRAAAGLGGASGSAQAAALLRRQRREWDRYQALLDRVQRRGMADLPEREVSRFAALYREVAADLARARTYGGSPELLYMLERSVGAGHNLLYRPATRSWALLKAWLAGGFPRLVRRRWLPIAVAAGLFYGPAAASYAAIRMDPELSRTMVPATMMSRAEEAAQKEAEGRGYVEVESAMMPMMSTTIISNNVQVTFLAFVGGLLAGLGTVLTLVFNGVSLGSVAGVFANHGQSLHLWTFVVGHGAVELTAICIAGGAGLWMGSAMLVPGRRTRREVLVERGRDAVSLIGGTTLLLVVAGSIEGFVSPSLLPREIKFAFALVIALLLVAYLLLAGRGPEPSTPGPAR
ncbi:MAG: protein of unknown function transrane [Gemmatimonadetes bacterium]|nr:protein of unknown function transrane [Gemmatimonadota bacterium]